MYRSIGAALALACLSTSAALANGFGATAYTLREGAASCGGCHGSSNPALTVSFTGPTTMLPGATQVWTATLTGAPVNARAGFAAAIQKPPANVATFSSIAGQPTVTGDGMTQISHGSGQGELDNFSGGTAQYTVNLTVPAGAPLGSTYLVYMSGNVGNPVANNWRAAATQTLTVGAPVPDSLTPNQAAATATTIPLAWAGSQGEHFRVLRKTGSAPANKDDGTLVYEGANTSATATGLAAGTRYFFAVYGKVPNVASYSATAVQAIAGTTPPDPTALTAMAGSSSEISLAWNGTSAEFKVLRKTGAYPTGPSDAGATVVYEGALKAAVDGGLSAGTQYFYRVWGKTAGTQAFSSAHQQATATTNAMPTDRHVGPNGSDQGGANACTAPATPCRSITRAMAAAGSGDTIVVQPGTYSVAGGEVFPIAFKGGVQLLATGSPADTFVDGVGDPVQRGLFEIEQTTSALTRVQGFTFRNGVHTDTPGGVALGGAFYISGNPNATITITGNVFRENQALGADAGGALNQTGSLAWGGAIAVFQSNVVISNNVFRNNLARGGHAFDHPASMLTNNENGGEAVGGALFFGGTGSVVNNTFVGNAAQGGNGGQASNGIGYSGTATAGALWASGNPSPSIVNNVFAANAAMSGAGQVESAPQGGATVVNNAPAFTHNLFFANLEESLPSSMDSTGQNAVLADPKFHSPFVFRLRNSSPANGGGTAAGAPAIDHDEATRPTPPSIGAYEAGFLPQAVAFGTPPVVSAGGSAQINVIPGASSSPVVLASTTPATCTVALGRVNGVAPGACTLTANQAADVDYTAAPQASISFGVLAQPAFELSVTRSGAGNGTVASNPAGIDCGDTCSANFANAATVTLSADPHAGSVFAGWSGACTGTGACNVSMTQARTVDAQFAPDAMAGVRVFVDGFED